MSAVNITNVAVLDNPAAFLNPFKFEISYECLIPLKDDLEWKLIYVGSAEDDSCDQLLESVLVGPVNVGNYRFLFQADPPDPSKIPEEDIIGVTVLLLTCSYLGQEFIRVGYYVNNDYDDETLTEEPPQKVLIDRVQRNILADKPRVTKFPINFHPETNENGGQPHRAPDHLTETKENGEQPPPLSDHTKENGEQPPPLSDHTKENGEQPPPLSDHTKENGEQPPPLSDHTKENGEQPPPLSDHTKENGEQPPPLSDHTKENGEQPSPLSDHTKENGEQPPPLSDHTSDEQKT